MNRRMLATCLLLFVAYSLVLLAAKRFGRDSDAAVSPEQTAAANGTQRRLAAHRVVVYYFHGSDRCESCRKLEAYAQEAVQQAFSQELAAGQMEWRVVDFDHPQDAHYDQDYKLGGVSSVALGEVRDGVEVRGKVLEEGLMLAVTGTKEQVIEYVQREIRAFLNL